MTDRTTDDHFDREIGRFLAWHADEIAAAPPLYEMAARVSSRAGTRVIGLRMTPQIAWILIAGLLIASLGGAVLAGRALERSEAVLPPIDPARSAYEAVFLRLEVADGSRDVIVIGVDVEGRERQIARLPSAWVAWQIGLPGGYLAPMGAVSTTGLLAIPAGGDDLMMHWEIYDLHRPQAAPIVVAGMEQFVESLRETPYFRLDPRGGAFWGPGERLSVLWYVSPGVVNLQLGFVDGRTGAVTPGTDAQKAVAASTPACRKPTGFEFACLAPDDSMIVDIRTAESNAFRPTAAVIPAGGGRFEIVGNFAGWLEVAR